MPLAARSLEDDLSRAFETAFIDSSVSSNPLVKPAFVSNDWTRGRKVIAELESELRRCSSFDFSVAFITLGGIEPLLLTLRQLEERGVPGRILTTDYLSFSDPKALEKLASLSNVELRMFVTGDDSRKPGFHTKGYLFSYENGLRKALIGSSNLTASALAVNKEWNFVFSSTEKGEALQEISNEFESLWAQSQPLDKVIGAYRAIHEEKKRMLQSQRVMPFDQVVLEPNSMQAQFVASLDALVARGEQKALLISATGTGKTFASAFALRHLNPKRALFLVHREQVLRKSIESYKRVFGPTKTFGLVSGSTHEIDADYVFATIQTFSRDDFLNEIDPDEFDIVVIDEVHRAGASSYQKVMDRLSPKLFLGMTASPDRPDGFDIYGLFDNNIVHEIRLQQALEENLLCPFHYFGITDLCVNGKAIDETSDFSYLVADDRVSHIIEQARYYGYSGDRVRGLVFCRTNHEAKALSDAFNLRGFRTVALSGSDSQEDRERAVARLTVDDRGAGGAAGGGVARENALAAEDARVDVANGKTYKHAKCVARAAEDARVDVANDGPLDYIFTVDIFNEGVDIPEINQVIMLRPTQSPIVFVQQLGRGLRKANEKEFVVVLDFIGNYGNNYLIPIALSGDRSYNKDSVRRYVREGDRVIPGLSSIHFDEVSQKRIFSSIDSSKTGVAFLRQKYKELKHKLGRIPRMVDFQRFGEIDPMLIVNDNRFRSYYRFLAKYEPGSVWNLSEKGQLAVEFLSQYLANGMRPHELQIVSDLLEGRKCTKDSVDRELVHYWVDDSFGLDSVGSSYDSAVGVLSKTFLGSDSERSRYNDIELIELDGDALVSTVDFAELMDNLDFVDAVRDVVEFGFLRYNEKYAASLRKYGSSDGFALYEKYRRKDVCRLLNWPKDTSSTLYGYRVKHGTCPIFVTYNKDEGISKSTQYADRFVDQNVFSWMTRSRLTLESSEVKKIRFARENGLRVLLFVKKSDDEGGDFYYLGEVDPISSVQTTIEGDDGKALPIVNFQLMLHTPVQEDMYAYLVS